MASEHDWERARRSFRDDAELPGDDPLSEAFVSLAGALFDVPYDEGVAGLVTRIVDAATRIVPGADLVSVLMRCDDEFASVASSDERAERADQVQHSKGAGPSLDAFESSGVALAVSQDLTAEERWPDFTAHANTEGLRSVLATGMFPAAGGVRLGALTFYSGAAHAFTRSDEHHALILAAHAATAIAGAQARTALELLGAQLRTALDSRDVIGQAKGILMERHRLTADQAFAVLVRASQESNTKLVEVAATLAKTGDIA